jgi:hypothetical protein
MKTIIDCKFEGGGKKPLAKGLDKVSFISKKSYLQSVALVMVLAFSAGCGGGSSSTSTTQDKYLPKSNFKENNTTIRA